MNNKETKDKDYSKGRYGFDGNIIKDVEVKEFCDCATYGAGEYVAPSMPDIEGLRKAYREDGNKRAGWVAEQLVLAGTLDPAKELDLMHPQHEGIAAVSIQGALSNCMDELNVLDEHLRIATTSYQAVRTELKRIKDQMVEYEKSRKQALGIKC